MDNRRRCEKVFFGLELKRAKQAVPEPGGFTSVLTFPGIAINNYDLFKSTLYDILTPVLLCNQDFLLKPLPER